MGRSKFCAVTCYGGWCHRIGKRCARLLYADNLVSMSETIIED